MHCGHFEQSSWSCAAVKQHFTHRSSGFTLLEVMVALAIFATAAMTL
ncbi:MAG: prepilin-type N-terminal cleavage/methylation domain-containing protein, partial [Gammaproteobacteria bacterium]|nr:prepilin-type N-terminal cleavage/methylation domain-containing protein [Gammaproteobacteria bacterium]